MKEKPILFSGEMVRAILAGRKMQTRRVVKFPIIDRQGTGCEIAGCELNSMLRTRPEICPHGKPGDRLWLKETACLREEPDGFWRIMYRADESWRDVGEFQDEPTFKRWKQNCHRWRSSIHLPRWASRITLEITDVRVDRLQDISEEDAKAEGVEAIRWGDNSQIPVIAERGRHYIMNPHHRCFKAGFYGIWESINGPESWEANPWVWCVSFNRLEEA